MARTTHQRSFPYPLVVAVFVALVSSSTRADDRDEVDSVDARLDLAGPVAVLPFTWSDEVDEERRKELPGVPQLVREVFAEAFAALPFEDIDTEQVTAALAKADLFEENRWCKVPFDDLSARLGAGSLVRGEITKAALGKGGLLTKTAIAVRIAFIDGKTGSLLWEGTAESSRRGGLLLRAGQARELLAELSSDEADHLRALRAVAQDTIRKLVLTLPPPQDLEIIRPRLVSSEVTVATDQTGEITVEIRGTPRCVATFDIGSFRRFIPLWETDPGVYRGGYIPQPGDSVENAPVVYRLETRLGLACESVAQEVLITLP